MEEYNRNQSDQALMELLVGRALALADAPACDARIRYHLARAFELTSGDGFNKSQLNRDVNPGGVH